MAGTLQVLFYLIPEYAYDQILKALTFAGYAPEYSRADDLDSLRAALNPAPQVILAGVFGSSLGPLQAQEIVRNHQLNIPIIAVADPDSQAMLLECLQRGIADCVNMEYLNCLAPAVLRALRYQQLELEKSKIEATLRQQNDLLNRITNTAPAGIIVRNPRGEITFANAYAQQKLRLTPSQDTPSTFYSPEIKYTNLDGEDLPDDQLPFRQVISTRQPVNSVPHAIQFPGEQPILISANAAPIFSPDGQIESIVVTLEDITQQRAVLQAHLESEERYRRLVELSPDTIAVHSDGRFVYINPAGLRLLGARSSDEILGRSVLDIIHPDYRAVVSERVQRAPAGDGALPLVEEKFVRLDGVVVDVEVTSMPLIFEGKPAVQVIVRDVTVRKQAERAIQAILKGTSAVGAEFFRSLVVELAAALQVRFALVGLLIPGDPYRIRTVALCADGRIANNIEYDLVGSSYGEVTSTAPGFFPDNVQTAFPPNHPLVKIGAQSYFGVPLYSTDGMGLGHIAVIHDQPMIEGDLAQNLLTIFATRAGAELERLDAEEKYLSVIENVSEGIFQSTLQGHFLFANTSLAHMLGYNSANELIAQVKDIALQLYVEPEDRFVWQEALKKQDLIQGFEVQLYKRDGSKFWISQNVHAVRDPSGTLLYYEGTAMDITGRREAEETIRQNAARTQALDAVSRTLAEAGLDYRTMLNNVARTLSEMIGDLCLINLVSADSQSIEITSLHHPDPSVVKEAAELRRRLPQGIDEDLSGQVLSSGQPQVTSYHSRETRQSLRPEYLEFMDRHNFHSAMGAPIRAQHHSYGTIVIYRGRAKPEFNLDDARFLEELGNRVGMAITNARLLTETERRLRYVQALRDIDVAITSSLELSITLNIVLEQVMAQLGTDTAAILLLNTHLQTLNYAAGRGFRTNAIQRTRLRLGESYAGRAALERQTITVPDLDIDPLQPQLMENLPGENFAAYFGTPLLAKGQVKGVLEVFHRSPMNPDEEWINYFEMLARQAAIAIDNANLFQEMQRSNTELILAYDATIEGWSHALDLRDRETEGHTQRVTRLTEQLARQLGVGDAQLIHIRRGALLHDIGKMGVPDRILQKEGELTPEEWEVMRRHPQYAFEMLLPIEYLRPALDIPYGHHERWDGQGYPRRLKGEQIPLAARIFSVVDVWDALIEDRPYRAAWPEEKVIQHLRDNSGTQFDPRVVDEFIKMIQDPARE